MKNNWELYVWDFLKKKCLWGKINSELGKIGRAVMRRCRPMFHAGKSKQGSRHSPGLQHTSQTASASQWEALEPRSQWLESPFFQERVWLGNAVLDRECLVGSRVPKGTRGWFQNRPTGPSVTLPTAAASRSCFMATKPPGAWVPSSTVSSLCNAGILPPPLLRYLVSISPALPLCLLVCLGCCLEHPPHLWEHNEYRDKLPQTVAMLTFLLAEAS